MAASRFAGPPPRVLVESGWAMAPTAKHAMMSRSWICFTNNPGLKFLEFISGREVFPEARVLAAGWFSWTGTLGQAGPFCPARFSAAVRRFLEEYYWWPLAA